MHTKIGFPAMAVGWLILTMGCGSTGPSVSCDALKVTVDGKPYPLVNIMGIEHDAGFEVVGFDKPGISCEDLTAKKGYKTKGTTAVAASATHDTDGWSAVRVGASTEMGVSTAIAAKPGKVGDPVAVCVTKEASFKASGDKEVTIVGLFEGTFCGKRE